MRETFFKGHTCFVKEIQEIIAFPVSSLFASQPKQKR